MSALERLFLVCMTIVVMLFAPATAWADDEHPKEGIDYFKVGGPKENSSYFRLREGANVYSTNLFKSLGTDMDSFREDNRSMTIPLCCKNAERREGCWSPNQSKHESDAAWQGCSADRRYLYVLPGARFEVSGMKSISFDQKIAMATEMLRCRGKAECINGVLSSVGIAPKYGTDGATATGTSPATPDPKTAATPAPTTACDQKCLLDKLMATGWTVPVSPPIEKIVELPRSLTFSEAHGMQLASAIGVVGLMAILLLLYTHSNTRRELVREANEAKQDFIDRDREMHKAYDWQKKAIDAKNVAQASYAELMAFVETLAQDLGVRLKSDADATGCDAHANLIKAFQAYAQLTKTRLLTAIDHLGGTSRLIADKPFAEVFDAMCRLASSIKSDLARATEDAKAAREHIATTAEEHRQKLDEATEQYSANVKRIEAERKAALEELESKHRADIERLAEFVGIKKDADELRNAYESFNAVKHGLEAKQRYLNELLQKEAELEQQAAELSQKMQEGTNTEEEKTRYRSIQMSSAFRHTAVQTARTDVGDMQRELTEAAEFYEMCLNKMELHLGIPLSKVTTAALADEALTDASAKRAEAIALRDINLGREQELMSLASELTLLENDLVSRDRALDTRVAEAVEQETATLQAQVAALREELENLHRRHDEVVGQSLRTPMLPNLSPPAHVNGNGNGHAYEHQPGTKTMPLGPGDQDSSPFDSLMDPLRQFGIDARMLLRPRMNLAHFAALHAFLGTKYELGADVIRRIDERRRASNGSFSRDEELVTTLYDANLGDAFQILKNLPFLLSASGGVNGRSAAPSSAG